MNHFFRSVLFAGAAALLASPARPRAKPADVAKQKAEIDAGLDKAYPHLDALYKDIHQHPELGFQEVETSAKLAKEMRALGFEVTEHVGKTGIVAIYKNGPGPTVMVRTELDALPMEEKTGLPYASHVVADWQGKPTPVAHSCGHDIHMAAWIGAAQQLVAMRGQWHGALIFIGQPAEEAIGGAKAMIADGLFTRFPKPEIGFAQHVGPGPAGGISYRAGAWSSNADGFEITFKGRGAHGSRPQLSIDPVMEAARFTVDLQSVVSREKDPAAFGVAGVGAIQAGSAGNIIPDQAIVRGTIRSYDDATRALLKEGLGRTAKAVAEMARAPAPTVVFDQGAAAVVNDAGLAARTAPVFKAAFGAHAVEAPGPGSASEDYSEYVIAGVPSLYWGLGGYDAKVIADYRAKGQEPPGNHTPQFAPTPEPTIRTGVEAMTLAVLNVLAALGLPGPGPAAGGCGSARRRGRSPAPPRRPAGPAGCARSAASRSRSWSAGSPAARRAPPSRSPGSVPLAHLCSQTPGDAPPRRRRRRGRRAWPHWWPAHGTSSRARAPGWARATPPAPPAGSARAHRAGTPAGPPRPGRRSSSWWR